MEKMKHLGLYQKCVLQVVLVMTLAFSVVYSVTTAREGFAYKNVILIPNQENGTTIYSGKIQGKQARFIVSADHIVEFQYGEKVYGPYTAKGDSSAIPEDSELKDHMTGVELWEGEELLFRGGVMEHADGLWLFNEDGSLENLSISWETSNGIVMDEDGNEFDPMEPTISVIIDLMDGTELTHKGEWGAWFGGVLLCIFTTISIFFADELFRWNLSFQIRNVEQAELSEWEMASRYIAWTVMPIIAVAFFVMGLQYVN